MPISLIVCMLKIIERCIAMHQIAVYLPSHTLQPLFSQDGNTGSCNIASAVQYSLPLIVGHASSLVLRAAYHFITFSFCDFPSQALLLDKAFCSIY